MACRRVMSNRRAVGLLATVVVLGGWAGVMAAPIVLPAVAPQAGAATPSATPGDAGDTRSAGQGPGLVGEPLMAIAAVLLLGVAAALLTLAYIRLTNARGEHAGSRGGPPETPGTPP
ncbi:MAG: hypothetical protein FJ038_11325 [Chloroflexi bacterium]|nr:hypothetical protein [Chloroflexota bacterium]